MCDIALGMKDAGLEAFAEFVKAAHVGKWKDLGLYDDDIEGFGPAFYQVVPRTLQARGRIHFNLTAVDIAEALRGDAKIYVDRYTAWELQQIVGNAIWFGNTTFYLDGAPLSTAQLEKLGIKPRSGESP
jgi:hypothetical protein